MDLYNQKGIQAVFQQGMDFDTLLFRILDLLERVLPQFHRLPRVVSACGSTVVCQHLCGYALHCLRSPRPTLHVCQ